MPMPAYLPFVRCEKVASSLGVELLHQSTGRLLVERARADRVDEALRHELEHLIEHARAVGGRPVLEEEAARDDGKQRGGGEC
jgi:hypothetical protein